MGCNCSKGEHGDLMDLAPQPVAAGGAGQQTNQPAEMTADEIRAALQQVAAFLHKRRRDLRVVTVGGVISTILLDTRRSTHDVDFFSNNMSREDATVLLQASQAAQNAPDSRLEAGWLNNATTTFIKPSIRETITREAFEQDEQVFSAPGLRLYAAPWAYLFVAKLHRISGGNFRTYDPADAAHFLRRHLLRFGLQSVNHAQVRQWLQTYQVSIGDGPLVAAIDHVNTACVGYYGAYFVFP